MCELSEGYKYFVYSGELSNLQALSNLLAEIWTRGTQLILLRYRYLYSLLMFHCLFMYLCCVYLWSVLTWKIKHSSSKRFRITGIDIV